MTLQRRGFALVLLTFALVGCDRGNTEPTIQPYDTPAPPGSAFPSLVQGHDRLLLAWTEAGDEESSARVRFAERKGVAWSETETIASGDLFVNWADFAALTLDADGAMGAHWLVRGGGASFAYGIRFAVRDSEGQWSSPQIPHGRDRPAEHGFVSTMTESPGEFELIWLDGREMERRGEMELRQASWSGGTFRNETILDDDVCTCCQTDAAVHGRERFVAYRDHAPGEIRDISFVRFDGNAWSAPAPLSNDGWKIGACPVNGPAVGSHDGSLTVAWFTQAGDEPRVWAKRSNDFGLTFGEARRIDAGDPLGRVDVAVLDDGSAVVAWLERVEDEAVVSLRRWVDDQPGPLLELGRTAAHRESGFPRLATDGSVIWAAWTETSRPTRIRLSRITW